MLYKTIVRTCNILYIEYKADNHILKPYRIKLGNESNICIYNIQYNIYRSMHIICKMQILDIGSIILHAANICAVHS